MSMTTKDDEAGELIEVSPEFMDNGAAIMALNRSEIDTQISTAKSYPRSIKSFREEAMALACIDEETAGSMFYVLPARKGSDKRIEGPSVRLAEVVGISWGNLRYGARIVEIGDKFVTAQGMCFDLEKNIACTIEVKRSISGKYGRYSNDMIQVTCQAAIAIARRQAIFAVVPRAFVNQIYDQARKVSIGKADSTEKRRNNVREWFKKSGVTEEQVLALVGKKGFDDVDADDLVTLRGVATALKDGETTVSEVFGTPEPIASRVKRSALNDKVPAKTASKKPAKEEESPPVEEDGMTQSPPEDEQPQESPEDAQRRAKALLADVLQCETEADLRGVQIDIDAARIPDDARDKLTNAVAERKKELAK